MKASAAPAVLSQKDMTIKSYPEKVSSSDETSIITFYRMLVAEWFYPVTVDIELIVKEGFPAFEKTIGKSNFTKLKKYFGIGCKPVKNIKESEIQDLLSKLRTVENAQFYLYGYKELLENCSKKLTGMPRKMSVLERAKLIRMYESIFVNFFFFIEDYVEVKRIDESTPSNVIVDYNKASKNNSKDFYPEELFYIYNRSLVNYENYSIIYDSIVHELNLIEDKAVFKEVMRFAELKLDEKGYFESVNVASKYCTLGEVRKLKLSVHLEPGVYPIDAFSSSVFIKKKFDFETMYFIYKSITIVSSLSVYPKVTQTYKKFEGSRVVDKEHDCYVLPGDLVVSGPNEASRFVFMLDVCCGLKYKIKFSLENPKKIDCYIYMAAIKFLMYENYLGPETEPKKDLEMADKLVLATDKDVLESYWKNEISAADVKTLLNIDKAFEENVLGYVREIKPIDAVIDFAVKRGYLEDAKDADAELIQNVIVNGFEEESKLLAAGKIKFAKFEKTLGITPEFAKMFFDRRKIKADLIEMKLEELKKNKASLANYKLLVMLYCYIIENHIKCGQIYYNERASLKPSMLRKHAKIPTSQNNN